MKERPILFSAPMVRAILDGKKTQTRRLLKGADRLEMFESKPSFLHSPSCPSYCEYACGGVFFNLDSGQAENHDHIPSTRTPYGAPGDRLWVKETWRPRIAHACGEDACDCADLVIRYEADGDERIVLDSAEPGDWTMPKAARSGNVTPLFMPRWASRITLELTRVRLERLQDITDEDIIAEGVTVPIASERTSIAWSQIPDLQTAWRLCWDSINGKRAPWASNPLVWVVSFKRVTS